MADEKRFFSSQTNAIKEYVNKVSPVSSKGISTFAACMGFRWLPKFLYNRVAATPDKFAFSDWTGIWVTSATGLIALSYGGTAGGKYWLLAQGVGNGIAFVFYNF